MPLTEMDGSLTAMRRKRRLTQPGKYFLGARRRSPWSAPHMRGGLFAQRRVPQFRIVAGERQAENQQIDRLVYRAFIRGERFLVSRAVLIDIATADKVRFLGGRYLHEAEKSDLLSSDIEIYWPAELREEKLRAENRKLKDELSQVRRLLAAKATQPPPMQHSTSEFLYDPSHSIAELLALTDDDEAEQLVNLLDSGRYDIETLVRKLGVDRAVRLSTLLGRARVAVADGTTLVATRAGTALGKVLRDVVSSENGRDDRGQETA